MTSLDTVFQAFFYYIEKDTDFFDYFTLDEDESMEIAEERARHLIDEAVPYLCRKIGDADVFARDASSGSFIETLNAVEVHLLVETMFLHYLQRDLTQLRTFQGVLTSSDLNIYSPANERKTFMDMVKQYERKLDESIADYCMLDRSTGKVKRICD